MEHLTPQIIAEITGGCYHGDGSLAQTRIKGAARDNRDVKPGNLFVCIKGARADGHAFANKAFESGAACCLAERELADAQGPYVSVGSTLEAIKTIGAYHRKLFDIPVIGITGSVGKTTCKELVAAALGAKLNVLKTMKNLNNELGVPLTLLSIDEQHEAAVIEMGISGFGEMSRLAQMVSPDYFIITKIGHAHLETLGDLSGVLRAKTEAFAYMKEDGVAILNGDDDLLRGYDPGIGKVMFGLKERNAAQAALPASAYGSHIAEMAGAAVAAGQLLGLTEAEIARGLSSYEPIEGRANVIDTGRITLIDDCYNANPDSVIAALISLSKLASPRVAILGDMLELGERSDELHRQVGASAAHNGVDRLICCGDKALFIYEGFVTCAGGEKICGKPGFSAGSRKCGEAKHYPSKASLIADLPALIKKGDTVLVKASNGMKFDEIARLLSSKPAAGQ